jgi:hypothetical protein
MELVNHIIALPDQIISHPSSFKQVEINYMKRYMNLLYFMDQGRIATRMEIIHYCSNS